MGLLAVDTYFILWSSLYFQYVFSFSISRLLFDIFPFVSLFGKDLFSRAVELDTFCFVSLRMWGHLLSACAFVTISMAAFPRLLQVLLEESSVIWREEGKDSENPLVNFRHTLA